MNTSCIILAGGKSIRFGHDKVLEKLDDKSLLEEVISRIDSLCREIIIVTGEERTFPQLGSNQEFRIVTDILPGNGSLGGIYTGLLTSKSFYNLVIACDMPFLNQSLLRYMIDIADGFDFVVPRVKDHHEPLHAVYSKNCIPSIEEILNRGSKVILDLFKLVKVRYVEEEEIDRFDPQHLSFFNINTRNDLQLARKIAKGDNP